MKVVVFLVTAAVAGAMAMTTVSPADAAKRKRTPHVESTTPENSNEQSWRIVRDSLPIFLPSFSIPVYLKMKEDQPTKGKRVRKARTT
jgi:hypothetical protein